MTTLNNSHDPLLFHDVIKLSLVFIVLIERPLVAEMTCSVYNYKFSLSVFLHWCKAEVNLTSVSLACDQFYCFLQFYSWLTPQTPQAPQTPLTPQTPQTPLTPQTARRTSAAASHVLPLSSSQKQTFSLGSIFFVVNFSSFLFLDLYFLFVLTCFIWSKITL